ncbi:hypothetical protein PS943_01715 [Pseudomonas fluorescens]|uniref:Uncharacterized protein n=1 Tax=Pseudomonas fluorescens TaxID=294 RepID=A0A5E7W6J5_PSEFL|nr:DUF2092 domain-containing protein [Pseudomonas fluorescens]VVQ30205.1 hypothetical protein PS943_01715 [Pseudomonas fluorescens]
MFTLALAPGARADDPPTPAATPTINPKTEGDVRTREFFYNGKKLTQYSPFLKYYTTVDAPPEVSDTLHLIEHHYGIQVPMEDLFLFGSDQTQIDTLKEALYVGPSTIKGQLCDHLAFRPEGVDWQLWITRSDKPLPCKLVITTTDEPGFRNTARYIAGT